ncbi:MAG: integration host factor subunit beta [Phycisphaerales bacterium]|nr:integration host factor subunit beta [Phycisphaerales bacterium]
MATITKKELIDRIAESAQCKRVDVKRVVQTFLDQMISELGHGNRLEFRDFGVFEIKERAPRVAQNPKTLERVSVPAKRTVKFKVGRLLKEQLDTPGGAEQAGGSEGASESKSPTPRGHKPDVVIRTETLDNGRPVSRKAAGR